MEMMILVSGMTSMLAVSLAFQYVSFKKAHVKIRK